MASNRTKHKKLNSYSINYTISERFDDYCKFHSINKSLLIENYMKSLTSDFDMVQFLIEKCGFKTLGTTIMGENHIHPNPFWWYGIIIEDNTHICVDFTLEDNKQKKGFTKKLYDDIIEYINRTNITTDLLREDLQSYLTNKK